MRISDWSSDVCSSDLLILPAHARCHAGVRGFMEPLETCCATVSRGSQLFEAPFTVLSCASSWPTRQTDLASARALLPLLLARPAKPNRTPALPDNAAEIGRRT